MKEFSDIVFSVVNRGEQFSDTELGGYGIQFRWMSPGFPISNALPFIDVNKTNFSNDAYIIDTGMIHYVESIDQVELKNLHTVIVERFVYLYRKSIELDSPIGDLVLSFNKVTFNPVDMQLFVDFIGKTVLFINEDDEITYEMEDDRIALTGYNPLPQQ